MLPALYYSLLHRLRWLSWRRKGLDVTLTSSLHPSVQCYLHEGTVSFGECVTLRHHTSLSVIKGTITLGEKVILNPSVTLHAEGGSLSRDFPLYGSCRK